MLATSERNSPEYKPHSSLQPQMHFNSPTFTTPLEIEEVNTNSSENLNRDMGILQPKPQYIRKRVVFEPSTSSSLGNSESSNDSQLPKMVSESHSQARSQSLDFGSLAADGYALVGKDSFLPDDVPRRPPLLQASQSSDKAYRPIVTSLSTDDMVLAGSAESSSTRGGSADDEADVIITSAVVCANPTLRSARDLQERSVVGGASIPKDAVAVRQRPTAKNPSPSVGSPPFFTGRQAVAHTVIPPVKNYIEGASTEHKVRYESADDDDVDDDNDDGNDDGNDTRK
jgi:hypothetical protein